jgi:hypothetical protein
VCLFFYVRSVVILKWNGCINNMSQQLEFLQNWLLFSISCLDQKAIWQHTLIFFLNKSMYSFISGHQRRWGPLNEHQIVLSSHWRMNMTISIESYRHHKIVVNMFCTILLQHD